MPMLTNKSLKCMTVKLTNRINQINSVLKHNKAKAHLNLTGLKWIKGYKLFSALLSACLLLNISSAIQAAETDDAKWYQVEIILFKSTIEKRLDSESWNVKEPISIPQNTIDFLQPYIMLPEENPLPVKQELNSHLTDLSQTDKLTDNQTADTAAQTTNLDPNQNNQQESPLAEPLENQSAELQVEEETPYSLLTKEQLTLNNEALSLQRHPEYKVLTHIGWRQPIVSRNEALPIRIAAGQDFSLEYTHSGEKRQSVFEAEATEHNNSESQPLLEPSLLDQPLSEQPILEQSLLEANEQSNNNQNQLSEINLIDFDNPPKLEQIVPTLWVPEVDGNITIYVGKYLHVKTNLSLRRPDFEEVEAIDINLFENDLSYQEAIKSGTSLSNIDKVLATNSEAFSITNPFDNSVDKQSKDSALEQNNSSSLDSLNNVLNTNNALATNNENAQFSWEIGDDFLNKASEKVYIQKLFNYPMQQSRRMRSKELHYFDHPLFGLLIMITPYEKENEFTEQLNALNN